LSFQQLAESYLKQAKRRLKNAEEALREGEYPYAVRQCQECVELSLKAALRFVGVDYPKIHDVSVVLIKVTQKFPEWFNEKIEFFSEVSKSLVEKRALAMYGLEVEGLTPEKMFDSLSAKDALNKSRTILEYCEKLIKP